MPKWQNVTLKCLAYLAESEVAVIGGCPQQLSELKEKSIGTGFLVSVQCEWNPVKLETQKEVKNQSCVLSRKLS